RSRVVGAVPEAEVAGDRDCEQDPEDDDDDEQLDQGEAALVVREAFPQGAGHAVGLLPGSVGGAPIDRRSTAAEGAPNEGSGPPENRSSPPLRNRFSLPMTRPESHAAGPLVHRRPARADGGARR